MKQLEAVAHRMASLDKWEEYTKAKEALSSATDTADSGQSDRKKRARLNAMRYAHIL